MAFDLRDRLKEGDRRIVGAAATVADQVRRNPRLLHRVVGLLGDEDVTVVAHAAHALMQVAQAEPSLFDPHVDLLLDFLEQPAQWEIGEQLPKILVRTALTDAQARRLFAILQDNVISPSNIVAAC